MFALRGLIVCFSLFAVLYLSLSIAVRGSWRIVWLRIKKCSAKRCANLLFALRLLPLAVAGAATLALAVPSFLLLEPRAVSEPLTFVPVALGLCGMGILAAGIWNAAAALRRTSQIIAGWSRTQEFPIADRAIWDCGSIPVYGITGMAPPLTVAGIVRPGIWLTRAAECELTNAELQCALRHELRHVHRRDNLRKLILRFAAFPGMRALDEAWQDEAEMAADDATVTSASDALDLAAAMIKLSRTFPLEPAPALTATFISSPARSLQQRIERLLAWTEPRPISHGQRRWYGLAAAGLASASVFVFAYGGLLAWIHAATEWLVR